MVTLALLSWLDGNLQQKSSLEAASGRAASQGRYMTFCDISLCLWSLTHKEVTAEEKQKTLQGSWEKRPWKRCCRQEHPFTKAR